MATITTIATNAQLKAHRAAHNSQLLTGKLLCVHVQFTSDDNVFAVAIADTSPTPNMVILRGLSSKKRDKVLKQLLESSAVKVVCNIRGVVQSLEQYLTKKKDNITPVNCADLQLLCDHVQGWNTANASLKEIASHFCGSEVNDLIRKMELLETTRIESSPRSLELVAAAAQLLGKCYLASRSFLNGTGIRDATQVLWRRACSSTGLPVQRKAQQVPDQSPSGGPGSTAKFITTTEELWDLLGNHGNKPVVVTAKTIGVCFCFVNDEGEENGAERLFALITGSASRDGAAVVLMLDNLDKTLVFDGLKTMLEDPEITKVTFDLGRVARWFHHWGSEDIHLEKCVDLQLFYKLMADPSEPYASMVQIVSHFSPTMPTDIAKMVDTASNKIKSSVTLNRLKKYVMAEQLFVRFFGVAFNNRATREDELNRIFHAGKELWRNTLDLNEKQSAPFQSVAEIHQQNVRALIPKSHFTLPDHQPTPINTGRTSSRDIAYVSTTSDLQRLLDTNDNKLHVVVEDNAGVVGVHFQFTRQNDEDQLAAICIVNASSTVVLQMGSLTPGLVLTALRTLFEDPSTVKVMHDIHRAAYWLHRYSLTNLRMVKCIDLQLVYENSVNPAHLQASMLEIVKNCESSGSSFTVAGTMASFQTKTQSVRPAEWTIKPLPESLLQRLTNEAQLYVWCYNAVDKELASSAACHAMTAARWQHAVANQGVRAIWFNPDADNQPRSLECFDYNNTGIPGMLALPGGISPLELQCDLDPVLELLPKEYSDAIVAIDDYHTKLVDVCLDVGRIPYVYTGKKQRVVLSKNYAPVTKETIDEIIANLGGEMRIGSDNRAGIDRQLHRISVMRDKTDEVYGLTMRVGRALLNSACVLTDLLLSDKHAGKSVLFLGKPGSGKTTLIRDVARCVSETMENVCIIDTSNEIGGDGLVPHSCVGWARRMMVPSLEAQASVMVECVQNHTVETLIVDEIGRKAEVLAASTVRQRGPRLIASAHGDFRSLIKNPDLKGLVGGSQLVILGDGAAARSGSKNKLQTQRAGNPIFDVIVELDHEVRGRCRIIWDAVREVDNVLEGSDYVYETRQWDASTCGVQIALNGEPLEYVKVPGSAVASDAMDGEEKSV
ncbi:Uncharacterized protein P3T76_009668 [Phytophthora citrophthora]|uniref:AAA+ ATPase domain-containing protein n=1 Tax=Phytophthora citrophthora TaxID=4793 RepID=A0AAD9GG71_9STRA|nr:Uncharacterized protein P3T76_009668 [Phytophthora citrophthora]